MKQERIWELDIVRGVCLLGVYASHLCFDLAVLFGAPAPPRAVLLLFQYGGILFVLLSGVCATLGSHSVRRGLTVLGCALLVTAVTAAAAALLDDPALGIHFGILHLLGVCMLLYPLIAHLPTAALLPLAAAALALGVMFRAQPVTQPWLFPLGLTVDGYAAGDYWPLFPHLAWFLLGICIGRTLYRSRAPRIPALQGRCRFLAFCGRHSLPLYLLQQPVTLLLLLPLARFR